MAALPHRYPMLLVDRVERLVPDESITAIKAVTINEGFFQGHFPGRPIMPGRADRRGAGAGRGRARGRNRSASPDRASWSISWRSRAPSSARRSSPACLLTLEVEFVQKRATRLQVRRQGAGRRQARRRGQFHGDDRGSAGGLIAGRQAPSRRSIPKTSRMLAVHRAAGCRRRRRSRPSSISDQPVGIARRRASRSWIATSSAPGRVARPCPQHAPSAGAARADRDWRPARRAAAACGRGASARAISTRLRSPVDSRSTRRSAKASSSSAAIDSSALVRARRRARMRSRAAAARRRRGRRAG